MLSYKKRKGSKEREERHKTRDNAAKKAHMDIKNLLKKIRDYLSDLYQLGYGSCKEVLETIKLSQEIAVRIGWERSESLVETKWSRGPNTFERYKKDTLTISIQCVTPIDHQGPCLKAKRCPRCFQSLCIVYTMPHQSEKISLDYCGPPQLPISTNKTSGSIKKLRQPLLNVLQLIKAKLESALDEHLDDVW